MTLHRKWLMLIQDHIQGARRQSCGQSSRPAMAVASIQFFLLKDNHIMAFTASSLCEFFVSCHHALAQLVSSQSGRRRGTAEIKFTTATYILPPPSCSGCSIGSTFILKMVVTGTYSQLFFLFFGWPFNLLKLADISQKNVKDRVMNGKGEKETCFGVKL